MKTILTIIAEAVRQALYVLLLLSCAFGTRLLAADAGVQPAAASTAVRMTIQTVDGWKKVETANFRCWSQLTDEQSRHLAETCEAWRDHLRTTWISGPSSQVWLPKCEVVVHPNRSQYNCALNRPRDFSVGSTRMKFDEGRTVCRRIDLRADAVGWSFGALPHELTHVVLGERFGGQMLPRWADEGIAMLSESAEKHEERLASLREILKNGTQFSLQELVQTRCHLDGKRQDAFYGQSLALSSLLIHKSSPARFVDFIEDINRIGFDHALQKDYQLNGIDALQREWNDWTKQPDQVRFFSLQSAAQGEAKLAADLR